MARLRFSRHVLLVQIGVLLCVVLTGVRLRRQSMLLPGAVPAPRSTPAPDRADASLAAGPTATPDLAVPVPPGPTATLIDTERFFYIEGIYDAQIQEFLDREP